MDLDPQGALSAGLGVPHYELANTVHNLLVEPRVPIDDVLIKTKVDGLDLVPSNIDLSGRRDPTGQRGRPRANWPRAAAYCSTSTTTCSSTASRRWVCSPSTRSPARMR